MSVPLAIKAASQNARAYAYGRPHDFDAQRNSPDAEGIAAQRSRAIVIGPIVRLDLTPSEDSEQADSLIEAQIPLQQCRAMGLREGDLLVLTPRNARVFVDDGRGRGRGIIGPNCLPDRGKFIVTKATQHQSDHPRSLSGGRILK
ncbi:hypothetical protein B0B52_14905 [Polaromonas sp. A23]|nr:hypothetical protein B0B52_14905 [Polaromonas sp. A23]